MLTVGELACSYAVMFLEDEGIPITLPVFEIESYWPMLFAKMAEKRNVTDLIMNVGAGGGGGAAAAAPAKEEKKDEPALFCRRFPQDMISVFWDGEDFPFPNGFNPNEFYLKCKSSLSDVWNADGDKHSRLFRMYNDILLWEVDNFLNEIKRTLVVVSDKVRDDKEFFGKLDVLGKHAYPVILVTPAPDINQPESPEWPRLVFDGGLMLVPLGISLKD
ncbi:unnamed protein product [Cochlearia groenlandica]